MLDDAESQWKGLARLHERMLQVDSVDREPEMPDKCRVTVLEGAKTRKFGFLPWLRAHSEVKMCGVCRAFVWLAGRDWSQKD